MKSDMVSIIVPIYNVEKYIARCIESLINQDYSNIEIILVDDGTLDNSKSIIDEYACKDSRIITIHKKNEGVSSARNSGIEVAHGEYIMFVDGDDWVEDNYVAYFVELIKSNNSSIAMNKNNFLNSVGKTSNERELIDVETAIRWIYSEEIFVAVWNKIYSAKLLKENSIKFHKDIWYGEGMLFNIECLQYVDSVMVGEKAVYHQTFNPNSAMRSFNLKSNLCGIFSLELQKKIWKKYNPEIEKEWEYHRYRFNRTIIDGLVRSNTVNNNKKMFKECVRDIRHKIIVPLKTERKFKKKIIWIGYFLAPKCMARISANKFNKRIKNTLFNECEHN